MMYLNGRNVQTGKGQRDVRGVGKGMACGAGRQTEGAPVRKMRTAATFPQRT